MPKGLKLVADTLLAKLYDLGITPSRGRTLKY
ncbi:transposase, degenerate, partial [Acidithiobacillus sp. GGI-221]